MSTHKYTYSTRTYIILRYSHPFTFDDPSIFDLLKVSSLSRLSVSTMSTSHFSWIACGCCKSSPEFSQNHHPDLIGISDEIVVGLFRICVRNVPCSTTSSFNWGWFCFVLSCNNFPSFVFKSGSCCLISVTGCRLF